MKKCRTCGVDGAELTERIRILEVQVAQLQRQLSETEGELEHLGYEPFIASCEKRTFHKPTCNWAQYILNSDNLIEFSSHREAEDAGYRPCKTCCA